jgi:hypothetical protein
LWPHHFLSLFPWLHLRNKTSRCRSRRWRICKNSISGGKAKLKAYCDIGLLQEQMDQAEQKKTPKPSRLLARKLTPLAKQIRPDYEKVMGGLDEIDPNSAEGKRHGAADVRARAFFDQVGVSVSKATSKR